MAADGMTTDKGSDSRDFGPAIDAVRARTRPGSTRDQRLAAVVDAVWDSLGGAGAAPRNISWIGFYEFQPGCVPGEDGAPADGMVLLARRDKPACSPIGLHGACGRSWRMRRSLIVRDVAALGGGYIACDPRDRSEAVVPLFAPGGLCWGVLDADSYDAGAFTADDVESFWRLCVAAGLTSGDPPSCDTV